MCPRMHKRQGVCLCGCDASTSLAGLSATRVGTIADTQGLSAVAPDRPLRPPLCSSCVRLSCRLRGTGTQFPPPLCFVRVLSLSVLLPVLSLSTPPSVALPHGVRRGANGSPTPQRPYLTRQPQARCSWLECCKPASLACAFLA